MSVRKLAEPKDVSCVKESFKEAKDVVEKLNAIFVPPVSGAKPGSGLTPKPFSTGGRVRELSQLELSANNILGQFKEKSIEHCQC